MDNEKVKILVVGDCSDITKREILKVVDEEFDIDFAKRPNGKIVDVDINHLKLFSLDDVASKEFDPSGAGLPVSQRPDGWYRHISKS